MVHARDERQWQLTGDPKPSAVTGGFAVNNDLF